MTALTLPDYIRHKDFTLTAATDVARAAEFAEIVQNNQTEFRFLPHTSQIKTVSQAVAEITGYAEKRLKGTAFFYFITDNTDKLAGCVGAKIKNDGHCAEICYWLDKTQCGKGYVSHAVALLEKQIFAAECQRVEIWCNARNPQSVKVPQRLNYRLDGVLRDAEYLLGAYHDIFVYSKLRTE